MCWCEPFERLAVGQRFRTAARPICETDVLVFSALTGDWHPQHCDESWANGSPFGERIAHGMLIVSLAAGLVPFDPERVVALRRLGDVVFKRPVRLTDSIAVRGEIAALTAVDERTGLVEFTWAVHNQDDELVCRARVAVLWRRAPTACAQEGAGFWNDPIDAGAGPGDFIPVPL
jgi:3-hydroxybutyryl-CoA dehydratase